MATVTHRTRVRQSREETRERIIAAAALLLRKRSYAELTVDEVMREAGQGRTIFYRHFDELSDLLARASREAIDALYDAQRTLGTGGNPGEPEAVRQAMVLAVAVYRDHGPLLRGIAEAAAGDEAWPPSTWPSAGASTTLPSSGCAPEPPRPTRPRPPTRSTS